MGDKTLKIADDVKLGKNVRFSGWANLYDCKLGDDVLVGPFVEIQCDVVIGDKVKIQSHAFICSGVVIEDEAFIGHGVMFTNDRYPRSTNRDGQLKGDDDWTLERTIIKRRVSIGSNATIICGITIGENTIIGAGSVVTKDMPANAAVAGVPAKVLRFIDKNEG